MARKFGPTRGELRFRLILSGAGLVAVIAALLFRGLPTSAGGWEAIGIATLFFGGTFLYTLRKLVQRDHPDPE